MPGDSHLFLRTTPRYWESVSILNDQGYREPCTYSTSHISHLLDSTPCVPTAYLSAPRRERKPALLRSSTVHSRILAGRIKATIPHRASSLAAYQDAHAYLGPRSQIHHQTRFRFRPCQNPTEAVPCLAYCTLHLLVPPRRPLSLSPWTVNLLYLCTAGPHSQLPCLPCLAFGRTTHPGRRLGQIRPQRFVCPATLR